MSHYLGLTVLSAFLLLFRLSVCFVCMSYLFACVHNLVCAFSCFGVCLWACGEITINHLKSEVSVSSFRLCLLLSVSVSDSVCLSPSLSLPPSLSLSFSPRSFVSLSLSRSVSVSVSLCLYLSVCLALAPFFLSLSLPPLPPQQQGYTKLYIPQFHIWTHKPAHTHTSCEACI